jgi:transcriptional regulator with XRE-family HTH domain
VPCILGHVAKGTPRDTAPQQGAPFGARLRRLREAAGLTQEELASRAGLSATAVSVLERGERRRPYPHTVRSLADALGLSEVERASLLAAVPKRGAAPEIASPPWDHRGLSFHRQRPRSWAGSESSERWASSLVPQRSGC